MMSYAFENPLKQKRFASVHFRQGLPVNAFRYRLSCWVALTLILFLALGGLPGVTLAQKEVTGEIYRYREREMANRYYEQHEARPRPYLPVLIVPTPPKDLIAVSPTAEKVRFRKYLADAHWGLRFYARRTCISCHPQQGKNLHAVKSKITCRQCHGGEPIAGNLHYYSSMHPRRRYAFVCAKCHKGSNASFATYVIHEPSPRLMETQRSFPVLFYGFWVMVAIAVGTFAVFLPHAILWGIREFFPENKLAGWRKLTVRRRNKDDQD